MTLKRRDFLYLLTASVGAITAGACQASGNNLAASPTTQATKIAQTPGTFTLPPLPYEYNALEPHIDARTMQFHHDKHHAAYVKNLNDAVSKYPQLKNMSAEDMLRDLTKVPEDIRTTVRNNGGGHVNHSMFWEIMSPKGGGEPTGDLAKAINESFGSFDAFKAKFNEAGTKRFGSGWVWLVRTTTGKLEIATTANQDTPLMDGNYPIMGNDVWEHAYYLKYQNLRADYLKAWWNVVNWTEINKRYEKAI
ncbi:MAG: superoxide dismutase [Oscillatoriales cyanobacterium]|jgi:superoxide dismutase, Fe-Mn family|nr:MAG: superoxide dismutase [Oscillatoriales cyanobacterium]TAH18525.1 MAG: superoxide dismutase [Oscillatoriales cyanobacterium]